MKKVSVPLPLKKIPASVLTKKLSVPVLLLLLALSSHAAAAATTRLPFVEDDYNKALAEANRRRLPVFVDVWAPW